MSTDKQGTKMLTRTFFNQLKSSGYNQNQIIGVATELIDLVTSDLRNADKAEQSDASASPREGLHAQA